MRRSARLLLLAAAAVPLAGCISLGEKPPKALLTLRAATPVATGAARSSNDKSAIVVAVPLVPQALATQRLAVVEGGARVSYVKDALWVEAPARLFRALLAETIMAETGRVVPDPRQFSISPDTRLTGQLGAFGLESGSSNAVVSYDASLSRTGSDTVMTRRFEARAPVAVVDGDNVAAALNVAANQVAREVAAWVGRP